MKIADLPGDELERLAALRSYDILDSLPEKEYNDITLLASEICNTPISLISLIDDKRQWFKSNLGLQVRETPKDYAFCSHAILNPTEILIVPDSRIDERFTGNPLVEGDPYVIFYAGVPLVNKDGFALGSLCVIDSSPRTLTEGQVTALKVLAGHVMNVLELRRSNKTLTTLMTFVENRNNHLQSIANTIAKQIRPLIEEAAAKITALQNEQQTPAIVNIADELIKANSLLQKLNNDNS